MDAIKNATEGSRAATEEAEEKGTERLEFFSDAVIAISITLLVLDIKVPRDLSASENLFSILIQQWHSFLAFAVSFTFIGLFWATHHNMFRYIRRTDHVLLLLNTLFLMFLALIPFSTALLAEHFRGPHQRDAALFYIGTYFCAALFFNAVWGYASKRSGFLTATATPALRKHMTGEYQFTLASYSFALGLAFLNVILAFVPVLWLVVLYAIPRPNERRGADES